MYTTLDAVLAKLGQFKEMLVADLTNDEITAFIDEADSIIDGYIVSAGKLPFETTPMLITAISTDISVRNLWAQKQAKNLPEHVKQDYDTAIQNLMAISKGTLKLIADDPGSDTFYDLKYRAATRCFNEVL